MNIRPVMRIPELLPCLPRRLGKPVWIDEQTAADAGAELLKNRGPFRRAWAMVAAEDDERDA